MTVQSINKTVAGDTSNMSQAAQTDSQQAGGAENAFLTLLQIAAERFGRNNGTQVSPDQVLAEHFTVRADEAAANKNQARDTGAKPDRSSSAKDTRQAAKTDKSRQSQSTDDGSKTTASDDASSTTAPQSTASDDSQPVAASDDNQTAKATGKDAKGRGKGQDDGNQAQAQQNDAAAIATQQQAVVEIDVRVTEAVQIVETVQTGVSPQMAQAALAAAKGQPSSTQTDAQIRNALANLSDDDKKTLNALENRIVSDLKSGNTDDAKQAATELVSQLVSKLDPQQATTSHSFGIGTTAQTGTAGQQADALADMLNGTGTRTQVSVQVNQAADDSRQASTTTAADALSPLDTATQAAATAPQTSAQIGQQQEPLADQAAQTQQTPSLVPQAAQTQVQDDAGTFSAILAAQVEASTQDAAATRQVQGLEPTATPIAAVGAAQATDKPAATAQTTQSARAPRIPLQQQVTEQVSVQIDKAVKDGTDTVKIQLKPHELGKIEIKLEVTDGHVSASVSAEKPETLALLQKDVKGLEKALEDAGLKTDGSATSFSLQNGNQQQNTTDRDTGNGTRRGRGRGGADGGDDTAALAAARVTQAANSGSLAGVDISV